MEAVLYQTGGMVISCRPEDFVIARPQTLR